MEPLTAACISHPAGPTTRSELPVQSAVADGLGDMLGANILAAVRVRHGPGDLADFVVSAGAEHELGGETDRFFRDGRWLRHCFFRPDYIDGLAC